MEKEKDKQLTISEKNEKILNIYNAANERCRNELRAFRREWLKDVNTLITKAGVQLSVMKKDGLFSQIKSIFYSDTISAADAAAQLAQSMRSWIISNANHQFQGVAFILKGNTDSVSLYVSVPGYGGKSALEAAFPGIVFTPPSKLPSIIEGMKQGGIITGVPAFGENDFKPLYSLDSFIRGMRGKVFTLLIAANPLSAHQLRDKKEEIQARINANHSDIRHELAEALGESTAKTIGANASAFGAITEAISMAISAGLTAVAPLPIPLMANIGGNFARTAASSFGGSAGVSASLTKSRSNTLSNTNESLNRFAEAYEEALRECESRLTTAESEGGWETVACLFAQNHIDYKFGASLFKTGLTAEYDVYEPFRLIDISCKTNDFSTFIQNIQIDTASKHNLSTVLTSSELASLMSLPAESHPGIEIRPTPRFSVSAVRQKDCFSLGRICDREVTLPNGFCISKQDLRAHTLVTGLTGMGKSTTIRSILSKVDVPFLVLEPAKSEYRNLIIKETPVRVITAGNDRIQPLRINPFELEYGEALHSHIDALAAILNASFPMEGPMSSILEQGLVRAYADMGWDVVQGIPARNGEIPTMDSFHKSLEATLNEQGLCGDYGRNISGALLARINSLRVGARGSMFNTQKSFNIKQLLSTPTVIEMKYLGNDEIKAFLCGILLNRIYKYMENKGEEETLTNLLVIEEAHRLFRKSQQNVGSIVGNNIAYQSVTIFENILSEVRAYGLGIIIAEQLPLRLSDGAIKNTNLKIVHRLSAREDAISMGGCMGLNPGRATHICKLKIGEALVHSSLFSEPAHVRFEKPLNYTPSARNDQTIKAENPSNNLSESRPEHFATYRQHVQTECKTEIESLADRCLFTLLVCSSKNGKWESIWSAARTEMAELLQKSGIIDYDSSMLCHLLHDSILENIKAKLYIKKKDVKLHEEICEIWDTALDHDMKLKEKSIQRLKSLYTSEKISPSHILPNWLQDDAIQTNIRKYYQEAKQIAAAIRVLHPKIDTYIRERNHAETVRIIATALLKRSVHSIDIKNGITSLFALAVTLVLINVDKNRECTATANIRELELHFDKFFNIHDNV